MTPEQMVCFYHVFLRHEPWHSAVIPLDIAERNNHSPDTLSNAYIRTHLEDCAVYAIPYTESGLTTVLGVNIDAGGPQS